MRNVRLIFIGNPNGKRRPEGTWGRRKENFKIDLAEIVCASMEFVHLA